MAEAKILAGPRVRRLRNRLGMVGLSIILFWTLGGLLIGVLSPYGAAETAVGSEWPDGGLGWDRAREHAGTVQRVCGPLMSVRDTDDGTFVNVGRDYPAADRFTFIFWDIYLEPI